MYFFSADCVEKVKICVIVVIYHVDEQADEDCDHDCYCLFGT